LGSPESIVAEEPSLKGKAAFGGGERRIFDVNPSMRRLRDRVVETQLYSWKFVSPCRPSLQGKGSRELVTDQTVERDTQYCAKKEEGKGEHGLRRARKSMTWSAVGAKEKIRIF